MEKYIRVTDFSKISNIKLINSALVFQINPLPFAGFYYDEYNYQSRQRKKLRVVYTSLVCFHNTDVSFD